jgi:serine/threonine protein kinase
VVTFCNELARLLSAEEVDVLRERWLSEKPDSPGDAGQFSQWLVANRVITEYQAGVLSRGHADRLFIGPYKVIERIGKGRMAGVYKAVHENGQTIAIKILPPSKAREPELLLRFQREARLAIQLEHPNLVRTLESGEQHGLHYIVMEYLDGELLEETLNRRKKLTPREAVRVVYQALQGLQYLHEQAMVHRDLKPGNLMLVAGAGKGKAKAMQRARVKILDIGLGLGLFDGDTEDNEFQITSEGTMLGTPDYLAPEQARDAHTATIRADIYSLGCVLYHALTGQPPFPDSSHIRQLVRHATETPLPLKTLNPAVSDSLQPIIDRMLAKDPSHRYASPQEAARALKAFLVAKDVRGRVKDDPRLAVYLEKAGISAKGQPMASAAVASPQPTAGVLTPVGPAAIPPAAARAPFAPSVHSVPGPFSADVELVPVKEAEHGAAWLAGWSRREWLIFALGWAAGAGALLGTGGLGLLIARLLRRRPANSDESEPDESGGSGVRPE